MKVLLISVRADIGGGPKHLLDLLEEFYNMDIEPHTAIPEIGEYSEKIQDLSKKTIFIPFRSFSILALFKIFYICKKNNIKTVHSHGRGAGYYSRILKPFGFRVIHTFHGVHAEGGFTGKLKVLVDRFLMYLTDVFICVSENEKLEAIKLSLATEKRVSVIHNGVKLRTLEISKNENTPLVIGSLSRLNYQKGIDILIDYISKFKKETTLDFRVEIAGDGELESELKTLLIRKDIQDSVKFVGATNKPLDFLKNIDVYLSFSRWEGLPIAVLEAMSMGVPVILSDVVGNNDIAGCNNDILFNLNSYDDFKAKFKKVLSNKSLRNELSMKGIEKVKESFSVDHMVMKTLEQY